MCIHQVGISLVTSPALLCFSICPSAAFFTTILLLPTLQFDESMHTIYFLVYLLHPRLFPSLPTYIHYCSEPPPHVLSPAFESVLPDTLVRQHHLLRGQLLLYSMKGIRRLVTFPSLCLQQYGVICHVRRGGSPARPYRARPGHGRRPS